MLLIVFLMYFFRLLVFFLFWILRTRKVSLLPCEVSSRLDLVIELVGGFKRNSDSPKEHVFDLGQKKDHSIKTKTINK